MMRFRFLAALSLAAIFAEPAYAQPKPKEECATQNGQFAEVQYCVNSVLAPEGDNKYGPEAFTDSEGKKAWCEGVVGYGIGETVTLRFKPAIPVQEFSFLNGNPANDETFKNNSRVKLIRVQTSDGLAVALTLPDTRDAHVIKLPRAAKPQWVRFTILDVYPGARGSDTCIAGISPNLEQLNH